MVGEHILRGSDAAALPRRVDPRDRIVVFGDVMDDIVAVPSQQPRLDTDTAASIRQRAGGAAANTAAWLGALGSPVDFVGMVGAVDLQRHDELLRGCGVTSLLQSDASAPTGTIVLIVQGEQRTMLTERGANSRLDPASVTDELLDRAGVLHITGYSVVDCPDPVGIRRLVDRAIARGARVSVDPGSAGYIADFGAERFLDTVIGASVIMPNLDEGRALTGSTDPHEIVMGLAERFPLVLLTLGSQGVMVMARGYTPRRVAASRIRIVDPTGAGDAFAAGFLHTWMRDDASAGAAPDSPANDGSAIGPAIGLAGGRAGGPAGGPAIGPAGGQAIGQPIESSAAPAVDAVIHAVRAGALVAARAAGTVGGRPPL